MQYKNLNQDLRIKEITRMNMLLDDGSLWKFNALSLPKRWEVGEIVSVSENHEQDAMKSLLKLKNKSKNPMPVIKATFLGFTGIKKSGSLEDDEPTQILDLWIRLKNISQDGVITVEDGAQYRQVPGMSSDLKGWQPGEQSVRVSKRDSSINKSMHRSMSNAYQIENSEIEKPIFVFLVKDQDE